MDTNDILMSVKVALYEEKRKVSMCREFFDDNDYTIMATRNAIEHIQFGMYPLMFKRDSDEIRLFGYKVEVIEGDDLRMYLAKEIKMVEWSKMMEGSEEE